jgi:RNA polymerase sigma-70 factor (ECF subfamily)
VPEQSDTNISETEYTTLSVNDITNSINQLKDNYRVALTLNLIEGYDYEEIAGIMDITYQNSRTTISRAKSKLRQLLVVSYEG